MDGFKMNEEDKLEHISEIVMEVSSDLKTHIRVEELEMQRTQQSLNYITEELKEQKSHFDGLAENNRDHFDNRINACNSSILGLLKNEYVTKDQLRATRDETVLEHLNTRKIDIESCKNDILHRVRTYGILIFSSILLIITVLGYVVTVG